MKVALKTITPDVENTIVEIARVSSSRKDKSDKPEGLINYLIRNSHWSPFEHGYVTMEIETSKAIGIQLIRHRSFTFQEFSQRYQDVRKVGDDMIQPIELRRQSTNNRQSSSELFDPEMPNNDGWMYLMPNTIMKNWNENVLPRILALYDAALEAGVAREQARMFLPMATTTKIYMTGSVRSWIHFLAIRDDEHAQKEIRLIAKDIKAILVEELPLISKAIGWKEQT